MGVVEQPDPGPGNPKVSMKKGVKFFFIKLFDHRAQLDESGSQECVGLAPDLY